MSDAEDDLFPNSDDEKEKSPSAKRAPAKKPTAAAKNKKNNGGGGGGDLFDSSEDEDNGGKSGGKAPMSRKERMDALAKKKRSTDAADGDKKKSSSSTAKPSASKEASAKKKDSGYESGDSYDSAAFVRTKEDDDFIDTTGEDPEHVQELYAEQRFDDERPDDEDDEGHRGKKKKKRKRLDAPEAEEANEQGVPTNPIMAVVHKMKRKKKEKKSLAEKEELIRTFLGRMELAAEEDEQAVAERRPALQKLQILGEVEEMLTNRELSRLLLDMDVLSVCKRWIQPLPGGKLGNVTVRQRLLQSISHLNTGNDDSIQHDDLRRSELGKVVMILYKHPDEVQSVKRLCKQLIEHWSRPIFAKSGNMRDLERFNRQGTGLAAMKRRADAQQLAYDRQEQEQRRVEGGKHANLQSLIASGKSGTESKASANRVSVPFSKGFAFSVRPEGRAQATDPKSRGPPPAKDNRGKLAKRMMEKGRAVGKNQRSANISVEGRATKS